MVTRRLAFRLAAGLGALALCAALPSELEELHLHDWTAFVHRASDNAPMRWVVDALGRLAGLIHPPADPGHEETPQEAASGSSMAQSDAATALGLDLSDLREALAFYKAGDLIHGDETAARAPEPLVKTTLEWVALRHFRQNAGLTRLRSFLDRNPGWPGAEWLHRRIEQVLFGEHDKPAEIKAYFSATPPLTAIGKLALARALQSEGDGAQATAIVRSVWRESDLTPALEAKVKSEFSGLIDKSDDKYRADRLLYKNQVAGGLRAALLAGPDVVALAKARIAASEEAANSAKLLASVPGALQNDPAYLFARIQTLRHADKIREAADLMLATPRDRRRLIDGDEWWIERRMIARKLLDQGDAKTAYRICAEHSAESNEQKIDAEFQAGWIALRFLNEPDRAATHFAAAAQYAETPLSVSRTAYWQGRAAEISGRDDALAQATAFYEKAAAQSTTYYGQIARERLGRGTLSMRDLGRPAAREDRDLSLRVIEILFAIGERDLALPLVLEAAKHLDAETQVAALIALVAKEGDAHLSLSVGKILSHRGVNADALAFPAYGIPDFEPLPNSAPKAVIYSVARQESAFDAKALSSAGAKGLMQMITPTARRTAEHAGVGFDDARLLSDTAFNAQLGAAHLGALLAEQGGSYILTFAAYNAGGGRVKQWIDAYGDPRSPGVDPIDWVERIPFAETRNYVQRVMENLAIYRATFHDDSVPSSASIHPRAQAKL